MSETLETHPLHEPHQTDSILPSADTILMALGLTPDFPRSLKRGLQRASYRAAINWFLAYTPGPDASNVEKVRGCLEAFQHLVQAEAWVKAYALLVLPLHTPTHDDLGTQLGIWGYFREQEQLYSRLCQKIDRHVDARCLRGMATARHSLNDFEGARQIYDACYVLFEELQQPEKAAWILHSLGLLEADQGKDQKARVYYDHAIARFRALKHNRGTASVLKDIGRVEANRGNSEVARRCFEEILRVHLQDPEMKGPVGCAWGHYDLGWFLAGQEEDVEARRHSRQALKLFRKLGHGLGIAWSLYSLGILMVNVGKNASASVLTRQALTRFRILEDRVGVAWACHIMGRVALNTENAELMNACYQESLTLHEEQQNETGIAFALEGLAHVALAQNAPERGARLFGAAEALRERLTLELPRSDRMEYDKGVATARHLLGERSFLMAWTSGREMPLEQAIAEGRGLS